MKPIQLTVPVAVIAMALGSFSAQAQEREDRRGRATQNRDQERSQRNQERSPSGDSARSGGGRGSADRGDQRAEGSAQPRDRQAYRGGSYGQDNQRSGGSYTQGYGRNGRSGQRGDYDRGRTNDRYQSYGGGHDNNYGYRGGSGYGSYGRGGYDRGNYGRGSYDRGSYGYRSYGYRGAWGYANGYAYSPYYYAPRPLPYRYAPRRYYGSGGHLSIYFGFGTGYLYGAPYSGRIYGYRAPAASYGGEGQYYGDIRLQVNPPDAEVYVDGYYAGIVDDFDGQYQRLALEAGPHKIEIAARGAQSQVFDVYVDPSRTVDLRADLLR